MLSHLQLRHLLESAFLPSKCKCEIDAKGIMTVHFVNPRTGKVDLVVGDIVANKLSSSRSIATLIGQLKDEQRRIPQELQERRRHRR
jgi:hypothetical protein